MGEHIPAYVDALCQEIRKVAASSGRRLPVHTIFWGGGTPSLVPLEGLGQVIEAIREGFELLPGFEMTLEANPGTVTPAYLDGLHELGFNRISFGMQSARSDELRLLERQHTTFDVMDAVRWARAAGFSNLSLDLIFNLPSQTLANWQETVEAAIAIQPEHLSLYSLTIEEGTPLFHWRKKGLVSEPDPDLAADMYEWADERLERAGFTQYEISNWARTAADGELLSCRHNLQYWRDQPYFGFGAGAHAYLEDQRLANALGIKGFMHMVQERDAQYPVGPATIETWQIDQKTAMQETMMVGLRLVREGVSQSGFAERFGVRIEEVFAKEIQDLVQKGLLEIQHDRIHLTRRGRLLGNQVFMQFVGE